MQYVTLRLVPLDGVFGVVEKELMEAATIERIAIHYVNVLTDGTVVMLEEFRGDGAQLEGIYAAHRNVLDYSVTTSDDAIYLHVNFLANATVSDLLRLPQEHDVILDTPMEYTEEGALRISLVGERSEFQRLLEQIPDAVECTIEQLGEFSPSTERLFARLTADQQRTLRLAVTRGYFDIPRGTTCEALGDELGISASAVNNQLRRAEATILAAVLPDG